MKEKYKKLLSVVLALNVMITASACSNRDYPDLSARSYTIKEGDTLSDIALETYGSEMYAQSIADYNGIKDPNLIVVGDEIKLPKVNNFVYYTIKEGDTLSNICMIKYGRDDEEITKKLADFNNIKDPNLIKVGDAIIIPDIESLNMLFPSNPTLKK